MLPPRTVIAEGSGRAAAAAGAVRHSCSTCIHTPLACKTATAKASWQFIYVQACMQHLAAQQSDMCQHVHHLCCHAAAQPAQYGENPGGYAYEHSHDPKHNTKDYKDYPQKEYKDYPVHHEHKAEVCSCVGFPGQDGPPGRDGKDGEDGPAGGDEFAAVGGFYEHGFAEARCRHQLHV